MITRSTARFPGERRMHVGLAVANLDASKRFYTTLLGVGPVKERPGYAKFEPEDPSLNLALNEVTSRPPRTHAASHFGIQVKTTKAVHAAIERLGAAGLATLVEEQTVCCFAVQDKVWVTDPDGNRWETFVVLEAADPRVEADPTCFEGSACCDGGDCCETATGAADARPAACCPT